MSPMAQNWKVVLAVIAVAVALLFASQRFAVARSSAAVAAPQRQSGAVTSAPQHGEPISNEIRDFPQLD
jgi:hypothetical protein